MSRAFIFAAALAFAPFYAFAQDAPQGQGPNASSSNTAEDTSSEQNGRGELGEVLDRLSQSQYRQELVSGIDSVEAACAADIEELCGSVTPGGGRIALCVRANADQLSRRCRITLFRVARQIKQTVSTVADECLNGIKAQCGNAQNIGECADQKSASVSPACHAVVVALRHGAQKIAHLTGMPVFSSDGKDLGSVVSVKRAPDGKIQTVQIQAGRFLGLGDKTVTIDASQLQELANQIKLRLNADQVRDLPEAKKSGS